MDEEIYQKAVELVKERKMASVSMLQRALRIGYVAAARCIDRMEEEGKVGRFQGTKPREVLMR